ncbi:MAG: hypothetical protein ACR2G4_14210 [Pyrinomonadaceae bacterium]
MKSQQQTAPDASRATWQARMIAVPFSLALLAGSSPCALTAKWQHAVAQNPMLRSIQGSREQITQAQADLYERWRSNINLNQGIAFEAGRDYLEKYPNNEYAAYVRRWVEAYEKATRKVQFEQLLFKEKRYAAAFPVGKQILLTEPDNLRTIINLASAGYLAVGSGASDASLNSEALEFARRAIARLEQGGKPDDWKPFTGKPDALAYLNFIVGDLILKETPAEAVSYFRKAIEQDGSVRNTPVVYSRLAVAYTISEYEPLAKRFRGEVSRGPETEEDKAALAKILFVIDRIIDAYARAVALSGTDAQYQEAHVRWKEQLTGFYKFRHNDSTEGLEAYIAGVTAKPLP